MQTMRDSKFFLITFHDGNEWKEDEVVEHTPVPRVRQLLGGRWERSKEWEGMPFIKAFFNGQKRVLVMGFPPDKTKDDVANALRQIKEGREDRN